MTQPGSRMSVALTVAGSDSGGGAGIQADLKVFTVLGVWGTSAISAVTAQNTEGVHAIHPLPDSVVAAQIEAVASDLRPSATKTGMLPTPSVVRTVARAVVELGLAHLVVDPVLVSSHGQSLASEGVLEALKTELLPFARIVTPNLDEAAALVGHPVQDLEGMGSAAARIASFGPAAVLLTGGHLGGDRSPDLLWTEGGPQWLDGPRIAARATHGTGCVLSAGICAYLARGAPLLEACISAKELVTEAIRRGPSLGRGTPPIDPAWRYNHPTTAD